LFAHAAEFLPNLHKGHIACQSDLSTNSNELEQIRDTAHWQNNLPVSNPNSSPNLTRRLANTGK
jgi:hypothetical protein